MDGADSGALPIRAPVTAIDDGATSPPLSDEEFFLSGDEEGEDGALEAAPLPASSLVKSSSMPKAPVTDDDDEDLFDGALAEYEVEFFPPPDDQAKVFLQAFGEAPVDGSKIVEQVKPQDAPLTSSASTEISEKKYEEGKKEESDEQSVKEIKFEDAPVTLAASTEVSDKIVEEIEEEESVKDSVKEIKFEDASTNTSEKEIEEEKPAVEAEIVKEVKIEDAPVILAASNKVAEKKVEEEIPAVGAELVKELKVEDAPVTLADSTEVAETKVEEEKEEEPVVEAKIVKEVKLEDATVTLAAENKVKEEDDEKPAAEPKILKEDKLEAAPVTLAPSTEVAEGKVEEETSAVEAEIVKDVKLGDAPATLADSNEVTERKVEKEKEAPVVEAKIVKEVKLDDATVTLAAENKVKEDDEEPAVEAEIVKEDKLEDAPVTLASSTEVSEGKVEEEKSAVEDEIVKEVNLEDAPTEVVGSSLISEERKVEDVDAIKEIKIEDEPATLTKIAVSSPAEEVTSKVSKVEEVPSSSAPPLHNSQAGEPVKDRNLEEDLGEKKIDEKTNDGRILEKTGEDLAAGEVISQEKSLEGIVEEALKEKPSEAANDAETAEDKIESDQISVEDPKVAAQEAIVDASPASLLNNGSHQDPVEGGSEASDAEERDEVIKIDRSPVLGGTDGHRDEADGQIVAYSDEEETDEDGVDDDDDDDDDGKELFDSAALTALLKAASGASSNGEITFTAPDGTRIFSVDRPAGLGSSIPSLKPSAPRSTRPNIFSPSDLSLTSEPEVVVDEEEKKLQEKVDQIKIKFLRLVHRLGHSPEDRVAAQVLYRLSLAEGIRRGRQIGRAFSLENAKKKALELEEKGKEPLDFSCNILLLGKTGVGKSATINSIFGEKKVSTSAFDATTKAVREISGTVDGVKVRVIDTPGLRPSVMDQAANRKILNSIKKHTKRCPPDIVLYVDRLDTQAWDFNDLPLLRSIAAAMGTSIWFNAIVALTHGASAPPDGSTGAPLSYEVYVDQRSRVVQHAIRQAASDMRLLNPVALVENHPSCRKNREGQPILPNGLSWRSQLLLLCYSSKILSEANRILKLQDSSPSQLFGFRSRAPPLPFLLSSLLQSKAHPKPGADQGESDLDLEDLSEDEEEGEAEEEDEYDRLPPFKPLRKAQLAKLTKDQRRAYFDEYDYRVKLLQKKQWKEEIRRAKEAKKREKLGQEAPIASDDYDQDDGGGAPATIPVPLPDMVLPPTFDCDNPAYRYRFLEPSSQLLTRPVLDSHGWDHDCGYDGVSLEDSLAIAGKFPASVSAQITKDKKDFTIHLDSSIAARHGDRGSTLAGFDIQSVGKQLAYIVRSETKFKTMKRNKTAAGVSMTFLGENTAAGLKLEDELAVGKRLGVVASAGTMRSKGDAAYGANLEIRVRDKEFPIGQDMSTLGLSLMRWRGDLALGANLQSQFSVGRGSKVAARVGLNNKRSGQITIKLNSSEQLQIALMGIIPVAASIYRSIFSEE